MNTGYLKNKFQGSHNEWDPLEEVVLGDISFAQIPILGRDQLAIEYPDLRYSENPNIANFPAHIIEETKEDLQKLAQKLRDLGITVRRPLELDHSKTIKTFDWESDGFYSYCPRDSLLVVGEKIIEAPMTMRSRFLETFAFKEILLDYFQRGAHWISAPKPRLLDESYSFDESKLALKNLEPIFDAANILRAGRDLFYLISDTGNELGAQWLERALGSEYRIHRCKDMYRGIHIDSTISLLRPGLVLLNPERVNENNIPEQLKKWDKIWCPEMVEIDLKGVRPLSSKWIGMNLLMLNPGLALVDSNQLPLIESLERHHIEVMPFDLRHSRILGGGFHCCILDTRRKSQLESYF